MASLEDFRDELIKLGKLLPAHLRKLEDLNSAFPETQRFLQARGLTNVRQLDKQGMKELQDYLLDVYAEILKKRAQAAD